MFEQEYHTLCLGDEMPEISFHPEISSPLMPEDDFATNSDNPFKIWSLDDTLEELNRNHSCISPPRSAVDDDISEQQLIYAKDKVNGKIDADQNKDMLSELKAVEKLNVGDRMEFVCPICNKNVATFTKLFSHMQIHSGKLQCSICDKIFTNRSHLCLHIQRHMKIRSYHCEECTFTSTDKYDLILHISRHRNERKFECTFCKKKFFRRVELNYHKKCMHLRNDSKRCKLCNFSTHSRNILKYHNISKHQIKKSFQCPKCQVIFQHKHSLVIHVRTHTGEKPFYCAKCKKPFKSKSELASHFKLHEETSVRCTVCKQKFSKKSNLLQHMAIHTKKKNYSCNFCPYKSFWKSTVKRHIRTVHKITSCMAKPNYAMSDKQSNNGKSMDISIPDNETEQNTFEKAAQEHKFSENLDFCNKSNFHNSSKLRQLHSCAECNKVFKRKSELNSHIYVHKKKSFECNICNHKFKTKSNLSRHSYCHTGLKPYSCNFCSYVSNLKTSVTRHISSVHKTQTSQATYKPQNTDISCNNK